MVWGAVFTWPATMFQKKKSIALLLGIITGVGLGWAGLGCRRHQAGGLITFGDYTELVEARTKRQAIYRGVDTVLMVSATYVDWPLRQSYVEKYTADHVLSAHEKQKLLVEEQQAQEDASEFVIAAYTDLRQWKRLDEPENIWSIWLINDAGERVAPIEISHLTPVPVYIVEYYPFFSSHKIVYKLKFPKTLSRKTERKTIISPETKKITLEFTSALGRLFLCWQLKD